MKHTAVYENPILFQCETEDLIGIINKPKNYSDCALLIIVGGPQYRVGSHRQFVDLARSVSLVGIASMRFDYRGMGDSDGELRDFLNIDKDIKCAIDTLFENCPGVKKVVLWGLCDAATAASFYCASDRRVAGLVLLNPWIRENISQVSSKTLLKHYYLKRIFSFTAWKNSLFNKGINLRKAKELFGYVSEVAQESNALGVRKNSKPSANEYSLAEKFLISLSDYSGKVRVIISENDLTAKEFLDGVSGNSLWRSISNAPNFEQATILGADHTLTDGNWKRQVEDITKNFVKIC